MPNVMPYSHNYHIYLGLHHVQPKGGVSVKNKDIRWVEYFIKNGNNINEVNERYYNYTSLHIASINNNINIAQLLIDNGADIHAYSTNNLQPIHLATLNNNLDLIKLLIENGAKINSKDEFLRTPLHFATFNKNCKIIDYLLSNGADYYSTLKFGNFYSNNYNSYEIARYKLDNSGEKSCLSTFNNHDPINKWLLENNFEIAEYLPILSSLGVKKLKDINNLKNINIDSLFSPIEWSLTYSWLPTAYLCTPNCKQHKINLFRLINQ